MHRISTDYAEDIRTKSPPLDDSSNAFSPLSHIRMPVQVNHKPVLEEIKNEELITELKDTITSLKLQIIDMKQEHKEKTLRVQKKLEITERHYQQELVILH